MIDLHCHILPGIDDGARTMEESVEMCRMAAADGCRAMVATPHQRRGSWWNADRESITALARDLQAALGSELRVLVGGEVHVDSELLAEVEKLPGGGLFTLAGSRYLLIELDNQGRAGDAIHLVHELAVSGWRPVVAHPELIPWLAEDVELIRRLAALGALVQVTAMSVTGEFGRGPMTNTHALIDEGLVHFVASDCHGVQRRPPGLRRAYQAIAGRWGAEVARRLVSDNPRAVVQNRPLPSSEHLVASTS
jgi:protein-tyrosine phosphatase